MMILGEEVNQWGEPVIHRTKPKIEAIKSEPVEECTVIEDVFLTLKFLSEVVEAEPSAEEKKESILKKARIARENYRSAKSEFLNGMESIGMNRDEACVLWADADT